MAAISKEELQARRNPASREGVSYWEDEFSKKITEAQKRGKGITTGTQGGGDNDSEKSEETTEERLGRVYGVDVDEMRKKWEDSGEPKKGSLD